MRTELIKPTPKEQHELMGIIADFELAKSESAKWEKRYNAAKERLGHYLVGKGADPEWVPIDSSLTVQGYFILKVTGREVLDQDRLVQIVGSATIEQCTIKRPVKTYITI